MSDAVLWHDLECGGYSADLPLWRELAASTGGPVLDVGAGTGRVALDLAARGLAVTALDSEAELLAALGERARAANLEVTIAAVDAREFVVDERFAAILVPMQTVQLLGGPAGRASFLRCAAYHLRPGGLLAMALADALEGFDAEHTEPPLPDIREFGGVVYASRPVAVREHPESVSIERLRETVASDGTRAVSEDIIHLDRLDTPTLIAEGVKAGLREAPSRVVAATDDYVGSKVVILHA